MNLIRTQTLEKKNTISFFDETIFSSEAPTFSYEELIDSINLMNYELPKEVEKQRPTLNTDDFSDLLKRINYSSETLQRILQIKQHEIVEPNEGKLTDKEEQIIKFKVSSFIHSRAKLTSKLQFLSDKYANDTFYDKIALFNRGNFKILSVNTTDRTFTCVNHHLNKFSFLFTDPQLIVTVSDEIKCAAEGGRILFSSDDKPHSDIETSITDILDNITKSDLLKQFPELTSILRKQTFTILRRLIKLEIIHFLETEKDACEYFLSVKRFTNCKSIRLEIPQVLVFQLVLNNSEPQPEESQPNQIALKIASFLCKNFLFPENLSAYNMIKNGIIPNFESSSIIFKSLIKPFRQFSRIIFNKQLGNQLRREDVLSSAPILNNEWSNVFQYTMSFQRHTEDTHCSLKFKFNYQTGKLEGCFSNIRADQGAIGEVVLNNFAVKIVEARFFMKRVEEQLINAIETNKSLFPISKT